MSKTKTRTLIAYEVVNRADPTIVDTIELGPEGDPGGYCLDSLRRQMNGADWYVRNRYAE